MARRRKGQEIEGVRPLIEAIRAGRRRVHEVELPAEDSTPGLRELRRVVLEAGIAVRACSRGVRGSADPYLEEAFEDLLTLEPPPLLVALDRVTDVGNLGSIARSAESAGAAGLVLEHRRAPPIAAGALRASAGALEHLRVGRTPSLRKALEIARGVGFTILAADTAGAPLATLPRGRLQGGLIWVLGSEDRGVRQGIREVADYTVGIPLHGQLGSLGVAAAAAVLLLETARIRAGPPS